MKKYIVNNKPYFTICSVHSELIDIFNRVEKIKIHEGEKLEDFKKRILSEIEFGITLSTIAKEMGQHMEDALRYKEVWGPQANYFQLWNNNEDE